MTKRTENNFTKGSQHNINDFLVISEDCRGYIDSIIKKIYEFKLTRSEQCKFDVFETIEKNEGVTFTLPTGEHIILKKICANIQGETYYYDLEYHQDHSQYCITNPQLHYHERIEPVGHNNEIEKTIDINDGKELTQYQKLESTKKIVFDPKHGKYDFRYIGPDCYRKYDIKVAEGEQLVYTNLDGTPLIQPELIVTTFDSFEIASASFYEKFNMIRNLIDARINEISKTKKAKRKRF